MFVSYILNIHYMQNMFDCMKVVDANSYVMAIMFIIEEFQKQTMALTIPP